MTQALTVILKPGYAPIEQYAEAPGMKQGPWTDVYALAASVHFAITGQDPADLGGPPDERQLTCRSRKAAAGRYSPRFLEAIDRALRVRPEERTQTVADLRADLGLDGRCVGAAADRDAGARSGRRRGAVELFAVELRSAGECCAGRRTGCDASCGVGRRRRTGAQSHASLRRHRRRAARRGRGRRLSADAVGTDGARSACGGDGTAARASRRRRSRHRSPPRPPPLRRRPGSTSVNSSTA